ncbi:PREDICTED: E3 ubiquitin-protein ligase RNF34 [Ceratosolen solmsi marchali]|uniref:E3 ubiquitin-protein ligase RNF34 n=1 Tax=Ceratosolen solmsi marchali TaxID=326594 RepID=A0AAJ6YC89_9HYME|nr:PREDICTED: E3 ubiquitin-protein ligase RNF34 [Ceratosolen solmsi marchali]
MACEACAIKFTLFKRKKQCMDCLRYFCTECVIRRFDRILSCDNCSMLSRKPLIKSQILQMRSKYLRQYLLAKKVSVRGCIEKEDLVNLLIIFANGDERNRNCERENISHSEENENRTDFNERQPDFFEPSQILEGSPTRRSRSPQVNERQIDESLISEEIQEVPINRLAHNIEIEEILENDDNINVGPEPLITEQEEVSEISHTESSEIFTEIQTWTGNVKLSDINEQKELEYLTVKQLKDLLSVNKVDFKGCVERCELLDRAFRLWEEYRKSREVIEKLDEDALCKICLDAPIECVILECGHMACCINCGKQMTECPICRQYVVRVVRFFKA